MRAFRNAATAGLAIALLAAGCGSDSKKDLGTKAQSQLQSTTPARGNGSTPNTSSANGIKCPTAAAVSKTVGHDVAVKGTQSNKYCEYKFEDQKANSISVIYVWTSLDETQAPGVSSEPVSGLGQRAHWEKEGGNLVVWTGKGSLVLTCFTIGFPNIDQKAVAINLAKLVL